MADLNGKWKTVIHSYVGDAYFTLEIRVDGDSFTGVATDSSNGAKQDLRNCTLSGSEFTYDITVSTAMGDLENHVEGRIEGDALRGESLNDMGTFTLEGKRI